MPELPEVETVARTLSPEIVGKKLAVIECLNHGSWQDSIEYSIIKSHNPTITKVGRKGKLLLIYFDTIQVNDTQIFGIAFHLKMSGRLFYYNTKMEPEKHTRIILHFSDNTHVFFDDARKFGYARFFTDKSSLDWEFWKKLAKDPLEMSTKEFALAFLGKKSSIKSLLLQQDIVSGVGNIYADEALFQASIYPGTPCSQLSVSELEKVHTCLCNVLNESIKFCGSSIKDYRTAKGDVGSFQNKFYVYGRAGEKCRVCGTELDKATIAGRTTVFCSHCQKFSKV